MTMASYVLKRIAITIPLIFFITVLTFMIIRLAPGDPVFAFFGLQEGLDFDPREVERVRHELGLDQPISIQYFSWLDRVLHGDLGYSYRYVSPVSSLVFSKLSNTLILGVPSFLISIGIAIPVGVVSASRLYTKTDEILRTTTVILWSIPWFWYSLQLIFFFGLFLGWFPTHGMYTLGQERTVSDLARHMVLPTLVLGTSSGAFIARLVRSSMLEVMRQDYILTARSKGLRERIVIYKHALRNAFLPVLTIIGLSIGYIFSGCAVVESVFAWPGIGRLIVESAYNRDYPLVMGITLVISLVVILVNLLTDLAYAYIDPRIKY